MSGPSPSLRNSSEDAMAEIFSFPAYRYDTTRVPLEKVVTQPYDKISPQMQDRYAAASPYNLIPVEKGKSLPADSPENNVYTRAAQKLREWISQGILVRDPAPSVYVYSQNYAVPGSETRRLRQGFIALGQIEDYAAGVVFRHEHTLAGPKADRLELLHSTRTQTGQLFMLYDDPAREIDELLTRVSHDVPPIEVRDEYDVVHRLWPVSDPALVRRCVAAMAKKKLVIADGHHRYETALAYRDECRQRSGAANPNAPYEKAMMTFFNIRSRGLTILPTHRVIANVEDFQFERFRADLAAYFDWYAYPFGNAEERATAYEEFRNDLEGRGRENHAIGVYAGTGAFYLFLLRRNADLERGLPDVSARQRRLDVVIVHGLMLEKGLRISEAAVTTEKHITYEREMDAAIATVDQGRAQLACLLNPVRVEQVMDIALAGEILPQKSTDFYPKLLSGLVIYRLDE
jgi:uncharacterized protein (DUF1015 family)